MASAKPKVALRPMLPDDGPVLIEIFRSSIEELAEEDYSEDQREAWAARADDPDGFIKGLAGALTLVGTIGGRPAGFASLEGTEKIAMLYVSPLHARQGVATALVEALKALATARGATKLTVDASDTAQDFFLGRGFIAKVRNMVPVDGEWLGNTSMEFALPPKAGSTH